MNVRDLARGLLALAGPALVVGAAWRAWTTPQAWSPNEEVAAFDAVARARPAELVIVGPSFARTDVDPDALGKALAAPPLRAARFAQNLASAPMWYAILKERVYGNGLRPQVVLLVATLDYLLEVRPPPSHMAGLEQHFAEPDAVLRARTWDTVLPAALQRAVDHRGELREPVVAWFRDQPVHAAFGGPEADGARLVKAAGEALFGADRDPRAQVRLLPVVEEEGDEGGTSGRAPDARSSYLPDLAALVAAHGGRLVVVLPPVAASVAAGLGVSSTEERDVVRVANELGVGLVDLRGLPLTEFDYTDGYHMRPETRTRFTAELAARLHELGVMEEGPMRAAWVPPANVARREGEAAPPAAGAPQPTDDPCVVELPIDAWAALGDNELRRLAGHLPSPFRVAEGGVWLAHADKSPTGCQGAWFQAGSRLRVSRRAPGDAPLTVEWSPELPSFDADGEAAWWVHPGGAASFTYAEGLPAGAVTVEAEVLLPTGEGAAWLSAADQRVALIEGEGRFRRGRIALAATPTPLVLRVEADAPAAIRSLRIDAGERSYEPVRPPSLRLLDLVGGTFTGTEPPMLPPPRLQRKKGRVGFVAPWADQVGCSPIRVWEDGELLPTGAATVVTRRPKEGVVDQVEDFVYISLPDGADPLDTGRRYTAGLSPDRSCKQAKKKSQISRLWLYPGDRIEGALGQGEALGKTGPVRALTLDARWNEAPAPEAAVRVQLQVEGAVRLDQTVPLASLAEPLDLPLPVPLTRKDRDALRIHLQAEGLQTPVLLSLIGKEG